MLRTPLTFEKKHIMKNFNLEELERKTIYSRPESSFEKVQENVLARIQADKDKKSSPTPQGKVVFLPKRWSYAAAAAVVLLAALGIVIKTGTVDQLNMEKQAIVSSEPRVINENQKQALALSAIDDSVENAIGSSTLAEATTKERGQEKEILSEPVIKSNRKSLRSGGVISTAVMQSEITADQILTSLSSKDLAELSRDAELDVYLDLY